MGISCLSKIFVSWEGATDAVPISLCFWQHNFVAQNKLPISIIHSPHATHKTGEDNQVSLLFIGERCQQCKPGYTGKTCQDPINSCRGYQNGSRVNGYYTVLDDELVAYKVYCHFQKEGNIIKFYFEFHSWAIEIFCFFNKKTLPWKLHWNRQMKRHNTQVPR